MTAWKLGIKAVAIYRDGSKKVQPLSASSAKGKQKTDSRQGTAPQSTASAAPAAETKSAASAVEGTSASGSQPSSAGALRKPARHKLPEERRAITHKFSIGGHEGYITVGMYEDGQPGEIFIVMAKEGSTVSGLMDSFATAISLALQYGVPLKVLVDKFSHTRFEPSGWTGHKEIPYAKSIMDYIFRWLSLKFLPGYQPREASAAGDLAKTETLSLSATLPVRGREQSPPSQIAMSDAPSCADCGSIMTRNGSCYKCENCGSTSGCS
jgi:ribonucleoside-diphosphate reductase alpha chain